MATTLFTWGYYGWGNATPQLMEAVDAVEESGGFQPPNRRNARKLAQSLSQLGTHNTRAKTAGCAGRRGAASRRCGHAWHALSGVSRLLHRFRGPPRGRRSVANL